MRRLLAKASALFILGIFAGSFIATPPISVDTETQALTQIQSAYPYLSAVSESQIAIPETTKVLASEESVNARFAGMLSHVKWLISGEAVTDKDNEIVRLNKQIYSLMDDIGEDDDEDNDDSSSSNLTSPVFDGAVGSNIPLGSYYLSGDGGNEGILIDASGNVQMTAGLRDTSGDLGTSGQILLSSGSGTNWVATSSLGLTASATPLTNNDVTPDFVFSSGQIDEYCLTYEMTGDTWEWQLCGSGGSSFATSSMDTSLKLANIVTDETGTGALVFAGSPTLTGTVTAASANFSGNVGVGTTSSQAKLAIDNTVTSFGAELVTNGTFTGSATGWTLGDCAAYSSNSVIITYTACSDPTINTDFTTTAGEFYHLTFTLSSVVNEQIYFYFYENGESVEYGPFGAGTHTISFATDYTGTETVEFDIWNYNAGGSLTIDNISVRQISSGQSALAIRGYDGNSELLLSNTAANVALGLGALQNMTGGVQNVAIGRSSGGGAAWMEKNVFVGYRAGEKSTGSENIFVGSTAGAYSTGGSNVFIGNEAGTFSGASNGTVAVGSGAGYYSRGNYNAYFGHVSGLGPETFSTGSNNSFFGEGSGRTNSGSRNTFMGSSAGYSNTTGWDNTYLGTSAGFNNTIYSSNVIIGAFAGGLLDSANNTIIGASAGDNITSGARNIIIGYNVDAPSATASNQLNIGNIIFGTSINGNGTSVSLGNIGIGTTSPNAKLTVHGDINVSQGSGVIQFGGTRYLYASTTNDSIVFGELAGNSLTSGTAFNVAIGYEAGRNMSNTNADYMTLLGYQAGYQNTGDHTNVVGFGAGYQNSGDYTSIMGPSAGIANTGDYNNLIGAFAGRNNTGGFNNFIGHSVGFSNTGNYNNVVGYYAGYNNTGSNNDMMGYQAGRYLLASSSVVIGAEALYGSHATNFVAPNNVAIGYRAGYTADDGAGANILIGYQAADNITTGNNNIIIGYNIDAITPTADNRLNIGNLIFGTGLDGTGTTLASGFVGIGTTTPVQKLQVFGDVRVGTTGSNGCLEDFGGGLIAGTCSSDENLKENVEPIEEEGRSYLESFAALTPVTYNWNEEAAELYSKDMTVENLGLIAQDVEVQFPELVSLNDDGYRQVDFRAFPFYIIQALKEVWEKLQGQDEKIEQLETENEYLKERIETIEDELNISPTPAPIPPPEEVEETPEPVIEENPIVEEVFEEEIEEEVVLVPGESE